MPKPATAMMKKSRTLRMLCSIGDGPEQRPLLLLPGPDLVHRPHLVERAGDPRPLVDLHARRDLDLDLIDTGWPSCFPISAIVVMGEDIRSL